MSLKLLLDIVKGMNSQQDAQQINQSLVGRKQGDAIIAALSATFLSALFAVIFVTWQPAKPGFGLDGSWLQMLSFASAQKLQFGKEIIFTYGPWGFIQGAAIEPHTYFVSLAINFFLAAILGVALSLNQRGLSLYRQIVLLFLFLLASAGRFPDERSYALPLLGVFLALDTATPFRNLLLMAIACASALLGLVKFTYILHGVALLTIADTVRWLRFRRIPVLVPGYLCFFVVFWLVSGQRLNGLTAFLANSWSVASGFNEAMGTVGPGYQIILFLAGGMLSLVAFWIATPKLSGPVRMATALALFINFFWCFKTGFVRHDSHIVHAFSGLIISIVIIAPVIFESPVKLDYFRQGLGLIAVISLFILSSVPLMEDSLSLGFLLKNVKAIAGLFTGRTESAVREQYVELLNATTNPKLGPTSQLRFETDGVFSTSCINVQAASSSPKKSEDYFPWSESGPFIGTGELHTRPVFQSYSAYTPLLIRENVGFMRSDKAPDIVHFGICTIDDRFPSLDDGACWPDLLSRYRLTDASGGYLRLEKRTTPLGMRMRSISKSTISANREFDIPGGKGSVIWAKIIIKPTLLGKLAGILFKMPRVALFATLSDGTKSEYRLVPQMASEGFVLSPVVKSTEDFATLALDSDALNRVKGSSIRQIFVFLGGAGRLAYHHEIEVEFSSLEIDKESTNNGHDVKLESELWASIGSDYSNAGNFPGAVVSTQKQTEIDPGNFKAWAHLCEALLHSGQFAAARDAAEKAYSLNPSPESSLLLDQTQLIGKAIQNSQLSGTEISEVMSSVLSGLKNTAKPAQNALPR